MKLQTTMNEIKNIALIAHDNMKDTLVEWTTENIDILKKHSLCGTGTTARLVAAATGLPVEAYKSGPLGGDQQIGALIADCKIDMLIFFSDPLEAQPHDPDIRALLRISTLYDIPFANNKATADFIMTSKYISTTYEHEAIENDEIAYRRSSEMIDKG